MWTRRRPLRPPENPRRATMHLAGIALATMCLATAFADTPVPAPAHPDGPVVTSRPCTEAQTMTPEPGPACLVAHQDLGPLPAEPMYWHIDTFPDDASAQAASGSRSTVIHDYGQVWLFTIETQTWHARGGTHKATIGPLPVQPAAAFSAEYVHSMFAPGMTAPVHRHSGPEGFYALDGDSCLEMPGGVHTGMGPGNTMVMEGGPPMLLMAVGTQPRRAFALVLHDATLPATTRVDNWQPAGLCKRYLRDAPTAP